MLYYPGKVLSMSSTLSIDFSSAHSVRNTIISENWHLVEIDFFFRFNVLRSNYTFNLVSEIKSLDYGLDN